MTRKEKENPRSGIMRHNLQGRQILSKFSNVLAEVCVKYRSWFDSARNDQPFKAMTKHIIIKLAFDNQMPPSTPPQDPYPAPNRKKKKRIN